MLQGGWLMHEMYREEEDSTFIPDFLPEDSVILQFEGNSYTEFFGKDDRKLGLTFDVYDYRLILYRNDTIYDWINIDVLTEDSLVLSKVDYKWQYKRVQ